MDEAEIYKAGNGWQRNRYEFMARFNKAKEITAYGKASKGVKHYCHLVDSESVALEYNLLGDKRILSAVKKRFTEGKAGDIKRVVSNTVASQPCCFNLFAPLTFGENRDLSNKLFSRLLGRPAVVEEIKIEFTPKIEKDYDESIGDQSAMGGTDADVAIFYKYVDGTKGVALIEFKYIENEFSLCKSYKEKHGIRSVCGSAAFVRGKLESRAGKKAINPDCGYQKYRNWELTTESSAFDVHAIRQMNFCPFNKSLNQLWRNMLLSENVARKRNLSEFHFWVVCPRENSFLWKEGRDDVERLFRSILTEKGKVAFRRLELDKDIVALLESADNTRDQKEWLLKFRNKYLTETETPSENMQ